MPIELRRPAIEDLDAYAAALWRGWSPDNIGGKATADAQLQRIADDPAAFIASLDDPEARGAPIALPDGTTAARLPGFVRWVWDDDFCGSVGFRWRPGTSSLPEHVLGHAGYAVVPWKRGRGYATAALALLLPQARAVGLAYVELTTDIDNIASQRVILANGGEALGCFTKPASYGGGEGLRFRIPL
jgi:predicted acetyltransferase